MAPSMGDKVPSRRAEPHSTVHNHGWLDHQSSRSRSACLAAIIEPSLVMHVRLKCCTFHSSCPLLHAQVLSHSVYASVVATFTLHTTRAAVLCVSGFYRPWRLYAISQGCQVDPLSDSQILQPYGVTPKFYQKKACCMVFMFFSKSGRLKQ
jgi:hypothetical protein